MRVAHDVARPRPARPAPAVRGARPSLVVVRRPASARRSPASCSRPPRKASSITNAHPATLRPPAPPGRTARPPCRRWRAGRRAPARARRRGRVRVHLERVHAVLERVLDGGLSRGSLPGLRARMKPAPPRGHRAAEHEAARLGRHDVVDLPARAPSSASRSTVCASASGSRNSGVMSLKTIPGFGKSGMSWMWSSRRTPPAVSEPACAGPGSAAGA